MGYYEGDKGTHRVICGSWYGRDTDGDPYIIHAGGDGGVRYNGNSFTGPVRLTESYDGEHWLVFDEIGNEVAHFSASEYDDLVQWIKDTAFDPDQPEKEQPEEEAACPSVLAEAEQVINGVRGETHGKAEDSFQLIADLWSPILGVTLTPRKVAAMMILLKVARSESGTAARDHFVDIAGYASLAYTLSLKETE